jgi:hypothetical protein
MSSPAISTVNAVKFRVSLADRRMKEAAELVRTAAAAPDYRGPPLELDEQVAAHIAEIAIRAGARNKAAGRAKGGPADQKLTAATVSGA